MQGKTSKSDLLYKNGNYQDGSDDVGFHGFEEKGSTRVAFFSVVDR